MGPWPQAALIDSPGEYNWAAWKKSESDFFLLLLLVFHLYSTGLFSANAVTVSFPTRATLGQTCPNLKAYGAKRSRIAPFRAHCLHAAPALWPMK